LYEASTEARRMDNDCRVSFTDSRRRSQDDNEISINRLVAGVTSRTARSFHEGNSPRGQGEGCVHRSCG
jgi:hypothetical protein